jgi:hypothetical protein
VHDVLAVQVSECFADISKVPFDIFLTNRLHFNLLKKGSSIGVLQDHIGDFALNIDVDVDQLNNLGMGEPVMHQDLIFCDFVYLFFIVNTTFTATVVFV